MRTTWLACVLAVLALCAAPAAAQCPVSTPVQGAPPPLPVFPADNWWNVDISAAPVDANSAAYIQWIGPTKGLHPDFGGEEAPGSDNIYGIPYAIVDGAQEKLPVTFEVWDESDGVDMDTGEGVPFYPIPVEAIDQAHWIEGGPAGTVDIRGDSDRHLIMVDCTNRHLYELYNVWFDEATTQWYAYSGAFFDLDTNDRRPDTWTSADASGMAIFPGLVRYDEAADATKTDLGHAIRMTTRDTNGYVFPASHDAGNGAGAPPLGARLRLKALVNGQDPVLRTNDPMSRRIMRTMQKYGMIIADNGSDMYFTGTFDTRWDNGILNPAFNLLKASDFEVVELGWQPPQGLPALSIANASITEGNAGTKGLRFTVSLSQASAGAVTYSIATANGTALAGSDYVARALANQTIAAGALSKVFDVTLNGDTAIEANEAFYVNVTAVTGATVEDGQAIGVITNDDGPALSIGDVAITEGNSGTKGLRFTVSLAQASTSPVTYTIATANGTALAGSDYVARTASGQVIPAGALARIFDVVLNGDAAVEANETLLVNVTGVTGAVVADGQATGTLLNDDGPTLSVNDVSVTEGATGTKTLTFTVALSQVAAGPVGFNIATANGTALAGSDFVASSLAGQSIPAGQLAKTFAVTINGDAAVEANETLTANVGVATGATILDGQGTGTILNDDGPTLSIADVATVEGAGGTKVLRFTVTLSQAAAGPVTYAIATANGTALAGSDYVARSLQNQTIAAGVLTRVFDVTINGDTAVEASETFSVNLANATGASVLDGRAVGTITNDD